MVPLVVYAIRSPFGDQLGNTASTFPICRSLPDARSTTHNELSPSVFCGSRSAFSVVNAMFSPSGDHVGLNPDASGDGPLLPVRPMTKMPPPSRLDRKAMRSPSGENAG